MIQDFSILQPLREQIDLIDQSLCSLLLERLAITELIVQKKQAHQLPTYDPAREDALLSQLLSGLSTKESAYLRPILIALLESSKKMQRKQLDET